ncbi:chorismate mutase, partial [Nanoarchaeota archaeon]
KESINEIRKHIDRIDNVIINALAERMSLMPSVAEYKKENNVPITDEEREIAIMKKLKTIAKEHGLDESFVEEIFLSTFNESKRIQAEIIEKK